MASEYARPMLDVGNPRVFNCNVLTRYVLLENPDAERFFKIKHLNNLVLIKDAIPSEGNRTGKAIGTKLYFPFNENDVYEGGRTIFRHDPQLERSLIEIFGRDALPVEALAEDMKKLAIIDRLPSLDPFLMKDIFLNEGFKIDDRYFEVGPELWKKIEVFILERFEPVISAAFPDALASDERTRLLIRKIWEARDLEALQPLIQAFRLPPQEALEIFSAWKGVDFYSFQYEQAKPLFVALLTWLRDIKVPVGSSAAESNEIKAALGQVKDQLRGEWQKVDAVLQSYRAGYDKMFKQKTSSAEFVTFLKNSSKVYWELGNSLGKIGHASYCWDIMSKRFPERKLPWDQLRDLTSLLEKIFKSEKKLSTAAVWN